MKGLTLPCSSCKNILIRFANIKGEGSFEMKCPHCQETNVVEIEQKQSITTHILKVAVFIILVGLVYYSYPVKTARQFVVNFLSE